VPHLAAYLIGDARKLVGVAGFEPATPSSRTRPYAGRILKNQRFLSRSRTFVRIRFARSCGRTCGRRTIGGSNRRSATAFAHNTQICDIACDRAHSASAAATTYRGCVLLERRSTAAFRRSTKVFQDAVTASPPALPVLTLGAIAVKGALPLISNGKVIGAIGCSGGTAAGDGQACRAGAATVN
jgi:Haem-degrading